jgi:hypothetical protein
MLDTLRTKRCSYVGPAVDLSTGVFSGSSVQPRCKKCRSEDWGVAEEVQSRKEKVCITDVRKVSYGKEGRDFVNNRVKIEYGSWLGLGGIFGGTKRILNEVRRHE